MRAVVGNMLARGSGLARVIDNGVERFIAYAPLETLPWSLAVIIDAEEVILPALEGGERIISMTEAALRDINLIILMIILIFAMIITLAALLIRHYSQRFANTLTKPITELTEGAILIGGGDLEHTLSIKTNDELETLAETFNGMIAGIKSITAEKERIGAELDVATKIQASMLPCIFPAFPGRNEFEIYASMQPAKEVGGDFYDFFLIDENTLAVVMADVSGKGVPAALFMVIAKTLLKNNAQYGKSPKEVFESVNNILCENNDAGMFVTAFMGYLDIKSGRFTYVNAGHNPPLIKHGKDNYDWLTNDPDLILAGIEGMTYIEYELDLKSGDELFLYTDGVTEAMNRESELFSDPRLLEVANENLNLSPKEFTERINNEIIKFADGAEQADDITMLVLKIKGG
jgi:sigma-B regulation protein RsbU (phosphoserine phosphatase)